MNTLTLRPIVCAGASIPFQSELELCVLDHPGGSYGRLWTLEKSIADGRSSAESGQLKIPRHHWNSTIGTDLVGPRVDLAVDGLL